MPERRHDVTDLGRGDVLEAQRDDVRSRPHHVGHPQLVAPDAVRVARAHRPLTEEVRGRDESEHAPDSAGANEPSGRSSRMRTLLGDLGAAARPLIAMGD
jgi:hypothetical protein